MNQSNEYVSKWKQNEPKEPLNVVDTRTFAERVEEALDTFASPVSEDDSFYPPVTAEEALAILAEVEKELVADTSEEGEV